MMEETARKYPQIDVFAERMRANLENALRAAFNETGENRD